MKLKISEMAEIKVKTKTKTSIENIDNILTIIFDNQDKSKEDVLVLIKDKLPNGSKYNVKQTVKTSDKRVTAYNLFQKETRKKIKEDNVITDSKLIRQEISNQWKNIDKDLKSKFETKALDLNNLNVKHKEVKNDNDIDENLINELSDSE